MKIKFISAKILFIIFGLLLIAVLASFWHLKNKKNQSELPYKQTITKEDGEPIIIPKSSLEHNRAIKIPILMYHHIGDFPKNASPTRKDLTVSTDDFKEQVKWLKSKNYTSIKLENIYDYSIGKFLMPEKPVVFTFDDGYADVFDNALPILKDNGFIGSFAIITQYPKTNSGDNFYASWEQIAEAFKNGHEIVSHTQDHFDGKTKKYSSDFIAKNLSGSIADIKQRLGFETRILIYPYGHYTPGYIDLAKKAGFVMGVTVHFGDTINLDNLMEIPRVRVHGKEDFEMFKKLLP